jgi:hypothetical protein
LKTVGTVLWKNFDGDDAVEARVPCAINLAHSSGAESRQDLLRNYSCVSSKSLG